MRFHACRSSLGPITATVTLLLAVGAVGRPPVATAQEHTRAFEVSARKHEFQPAVIEVTQGDLVKITLRTEDVVHTFTIDEYRISKRAGPGQPVTFEFRADRVGTFAFYCDIKSDQECRQMRGRLVVRPR